jgi:transposase
MNIKYGGKEDWHDWIKIYMMCGIKINIITSVEISHHYANDSPFLKPLLENTSQSGFQIKEVSADKGYGSFNNRYLILVKGAHPFIPFCETKKSASPSYKGELWKCMFHFYKFDEAEFYQHYHKRSNVETTFSMIKAKFGECLRSKTLVAQTNEVLAKVLCHNLC